MANLRSPERETVKMATPRPIKIRPAKASEMQNVRRASDNPGKWLVLAYGLVSNAGLRHMVKTERWLNDGKTPRVVRIDRCH